MTGFCELSIFGIWNYWYYFHCFIFYSHNMILTYFSFIVFRILADFLRWWLVFSFDWLVDWWWLVISFEVVTWSWLAGMKFCSVLLESWQCNKLFINYILRSHVKSFITPWRDPPFVLPGSCFARTKFSYVITSARLSWI